ncbi:MAG TPA: hypothetical protein DHN33_02905 [Eubacteriaceae bacterium]|nr:hypothetical protein [Eubacteriaceae bacterium]
MLKDEARKIIESEFEHGEDHAFYHYNCAETLLKSCNEYYGLGLDEKALKLMIPFGGGFYSERACGVLTGALSALGVMYGEEKPTDQKKLKAAAKEWVEVFEGHFGSIECASLKKTHRDEVKKCAPLMMEGAQLFEEFVSRFNEKWKG